MKKLKLKNPFSKKEKKTATNPNTSSVASNLDSGDNNNQQLAGEKNITKSILLIGRTGKGKSTLANVLTSSEKFKESSSSVSETKNNQVEEFLSEGVQYKVIDTPGIGDNRKEFPPEKILDTIAEAIFLVRNGVSHVFFITDGRFEKYEMATYNILREILFDKDVTKHTTIVRTKFKDFVEEKICQEDIEDIKKENEELKEVIGSCQSVLHIDNPSLRILPSTNETKEAEINREKRINDRQETRKTSRNKLLEYLTKTSEKPDYISPKLQTELSKEIANDYSRYLEKKKELEEEKKGLRVNTVDSVNIQSSKAGKSENISLVSNQLESVADKTELKVESDSLAIGEKITKLESKKAKLEREIREKEEEIRQKVLKHIFNNYQAINDTPGSETFIDSVIDLDKWKIINQQFTKELVKNWLNKGFDCEQVQKWAIVLGNDFNPENDVLFCVWLRDDKKLTVEELKKLDCPRNIEQLRKEYASWLVGTVNILEQHNQQLEKKDWKEIHEDFDDYYQKNWEGKGFDYNQTKEWIKFGLEIKDHEFATYLRGKGHQPNSDLNLGQLKEEFNIWEKKAKNMVKEAQILFEEWLNKKYSNNKEKVKEIPWGSLSGMFRKTLSGRLIIEDFPNLEKIKVDNNELTQLVIINCENLVKIDCNDNTSLRELIINNCPNLEELDASDCNLTNLDLSQNWQLKELSINNNDFEEKDLSFLSHLKCLEKLSLQNSNQEWISKGFYNRFYGSLRPLKELVSLNELDISNTDIDSGLEYLPDSVGDFRCSAEYRKDAKCQNIYNLLISEGIGDGYYNVNSQKLQEYKQKIQKQSQQPQIQIPPK